jgi:peptidyl-prolyl cis-trans isomerase B (cyclophilin B)
MPHEFVRYDMLLLPPHCARRPITEKFIARDGKFVTVQMQAGEAPNGTAFVITRGPAPDLDSTNLVIGKVRV